MLVVICLHSMMEEYCIFFENLSFSTFSKLMEVIRVATSQYDQVLQADLAVIPRHGRCPSLGPLRKERSPDGSLKKPIHDRRGP